MSIGTIMAVSINAATSNVFHRSLTGEVFEIVRAEGNYIYLKDGRRLLDGSGGAAVTNIGHGDKRVITGIIDQLQNVDYVHSATFSNTVTQSVHSYSSYEFFQRL